MRRLSSLLAGGALVLSSFGVTTAMSPLSGAADAPPAFAFSIRHEDSEYRPCELVKIDLGTGEVTDFPADPSSDACVNDLAVAPDGTPWGIKEIQPLEEDRAVQLVKFSPTTGDIDQTLQIGFGEADYPWLADGGITFIGTTAYIQVVTDACEDGNEPCLYTVNTTTGSPTMVGGSGAVETYMYGLANCNGLVTFSDVAADTWFATVNQTNGAVTPVGSPGDHETVGYDCSGTYGYALARIYEPGKQDALLVLAAMNQTTGALTGAQHTVDGDVRLLALAPAQMPDTTTSTTAPSTTTTSTTQATRPAANTVQPRFAG